MPQASFHTVVPGDTLARIARANDLSLKALEDMNPQIHDPARIHPGDKVWLSPAEARAEVHGDAFVGHVAAPQNDGYQPVTLEQLRSIFPVTSRSKLQSMLGPLNRAMNEFEINTPARQRAFLAQVGHESMGLQRTREFASGRAYEGRSDLGNTQPGDGRRFRGRGLLQITGRANYARMGKALDLNLLRQPELLEQPLNAARSAAQFWQSRGLNELADEGRFTKITRRINGGLRGQADRVKYLRRAERAIP